jgi:seryl-tRNA synthetase
VNALDNDTEHRLTEVEQRSKSNSHRLDEVEQRQDNLDKLVASVEVLATKQENVESDVKEIKADVKTLTDKPGKRWDTIVDKLIWAVLAAVLAYFLAKVGL